MCASLWICYVYVVTVYTCLCTRVCVHLLLCRLEVTLCEHRRIKCCLRTCAVRVVRRCLSVVSWLRVHVRYLCTGWVSVCLPLDQPADHSPCVCWESMIVNVVYCTRSIVYFDYLCCGYCYLFWRVHVDVCTTCLFYCLSWLFVWLVLFVILVYSWLTRVSSDTRLMIGSRGCHSPEAVHLWWLMVEVQASHDHCRSM